MKNITTKIKRFITKEEGLTTVEYAVAGAVVAAGALAAFTGLGGAVAAKLGVLTGAVG